MRNRDSITAHPRDPRRETAPGHILRFPTWRLKFPTPLFEIPVAGFGISEEILSPHPLPFTPIELDEFRYDLGRSPRDQSGRFHRPFERARDQGPVVVRLRQT